MFNYDNGRWWPAWALLLLPYLLWLFRLCRGTMDRINWRAAFATVIVFEFVLGSAEVYSVSRGHWVYNEARIWGPKLLNVPIEEHLLYYLFPPLIVIAAMHDIRRRLEEKEKG